jgi:DNA (cytosine-5)-methyltransferase 1
MRYLDVCAGISASTVAWKPLGWEAAAYSEIEAAPRAILAHHYPDTPLHGDFTTIRGDEYGPIDLLVGGTPCQDFSVAGLRAGLDGDRGNLSLEFLRLADRTRPRWLVWENVPGVLSIDGGRAFGAILGGLGQLGYGFAYRVLDAQHFGVPQRRRRVFVVGCLGDWRRAGAVLFERHSLSGHPAPRRSQGQGITHDLAPCIGASGRGFERGGDTRGQDPVVAVLGFANVSDGSAARNATDLAPPLTLRHGDAGMVAFALRGRECGSVPEVEGDGARASALRAASGGSSRDYVAIPLLEIGKGTTSRGEGPNGSGLGRDGDPMFTLQAGAQHGVGTASAVRRLTPRECERLQGFPNDYTLVPYRKGMMADGPRYKALGNSMAVPCMLWLGQRIQMVEDLCSNAKAAA